MDRSFNRIELRGNAGQDARIIKVGDNTVARFNIATNETYKDRSGNLKEETTWHSVTAWAGKGMPDYRTSEAEPLYDGKRRGEGFLRGACVQSQH